MPQEVPRGFPDGRIDREILLRDVFNNNSIFKDPDIVNQIVRGQMGEPSAEADPGFNDDLINALFDENLDLAALNINRAREHGVPGYNTFREICQSGAFGRVESFEELTNDGFITRSDMELLRAAYDDVDDIDLFVGLSLEEKFQDALLGPTFACIIGDQFVRLKEGDRFYFEHGQDSNTRFTLDQLDGIRKVSMARIICDNTDIKETQPLVFMTNDQRGNRVTSCDNIPELDLNLFREL